MNSTGNGEALRNILPQEIVTEYFFATWLTFTLAASTEA